jgi:hypothetical protein
MGIHAWEIWNEPNARGFWQPSPDAGRYVSLLKAVVPAIRAAVPTATLISGGLAPKSTSGGDVSQLDYLTAFCEQGGPQLVDAIGYHPYSFPVPPGFSASKNAWAQIASTPTSFKTILASHGFPDMKVWATEYGAPTDGPGGRATTSDYLLGRRADHVSENLQAVMAGDSVQLAKSSPLIGALFWYTARDISPDRSDPQNFFGLRRFDNTPKPAYDAFRKAVLAATS